jgi:hypothetical protein
MTLIGTGAPVVELEPGILSREPVTQPDVHSQRFDGSNVSSHLTLLKSLDQKPAEREKQITRPEEEYGQSLRGMRAAGLVALAEMVEVELLKTPEVRRLAAEFKTAFGEMLKTANGIGELVTMEDRDSFYVVNGKVLDEAGEPMEEMIARGAARSREISETSMPAMAIQADRDEADGFLLTEVVQPMFEPGCDYNTVIAVSALPEDGIEEYGSEFWEELGYNLKFECAILEMFHRRSSGQLLTRTLSIDHSNVARLAAKLRERGVDVPENVGVTELIKHPKLGHMTYDEATQFMDEFVADCEAEAGLPPKVATTYELVQRYGHLRRQVFKDIYLEVARSLALGERTSRLREFSDKLVHLKAVGTYKSEIDRLRVGYTSKFNDSEARLMHGVILYGLAEKVRSDIEFRGGIHPTGSGKSGQSAVLRVVHSYGKQAGIRLANLADNLFMHITQGIQAGRSYGGCGALFRFAFNTPQQVFAGNKNRTRKDTEEDAGDGLGPIEFQCSNKHWCRRPFRKKLPRCRKCNDNGESVGCGPNTSQATKYSL